MRIRRKCRKCEYLDDEDELAECVYGIQFYQGDRIDLFCPTFIFDLRVCPLRIVNKMNTCKVCGRKGVHKIQLCSPMNGIWSKEAEK